MSPSGFREEVKKIKSLQKDGRTTATDNGWSEKSTIEPSIRVS